jgi:DNA-binding NtrC family response regulator
VVDKEPRSLQDVQRILGDSLADVSGFGSSKDALGAVVDASQRGAAYDVVLIDHSTPDHGSQEILETVQKNSPASRVIVMSTKDLDQVALEAMRMGAFDFIAKPINSSELRMRVERALRDREIESTPRSDRTRRPRKEDVIIGASPWIKTLFEQISMVATTDIAVAIYGESGTGKELVARTIHNLSHRFQKPFVVVNCAAIPESLLEDELFGHVRGAFTDARFDREGLFAAADGGTLFLDEIGEISLNMQAKLLRVLQSHEFRPLGGNRDVRVDVRIITATNRDLEKSVALGEFRQDLYYRVNVFPMVVEPLRERREDIPLLAHHFLLKYRQRVGKGIKGFTTGAIEKLSGYGYPGNVRELENKIHQALILAHGEWVTETDIPLAPMTAAERPRIDVSRSFRDAKKDVVENFERLYILEVIEKNQGNLAAAARQAGMDRKNLWALARKYGLNLRALRQKD